MHCVYVMDSIALVEQKKTEKKCVGLGENMAHFTAMLSCSPSPFWQEMNFNDNKEFVSDNIPA